MNLWIAPGEQEFIAQGNRLFAVRGAHGRWLTLLIDREGQHPVASSARRVAAERHARSFADISLVPSGLHHNIARRNSREEMRWPLLLWRTDIGVT